MKASARRGRDRTGEGKSAGGRWRLQDAKARFSELVRLARAEGPQRVTVHGRDAVVVVAAEDYDRLQPPLTGRAIVEALRDSPLREVEIERLSIRAP
jgi:antitoxin Phd